MERQAVALGPARRELFDQSDSLLGDIPALVIPFTSALAELPAPTYRARFLDQALHDPPTVELLRGSADDELATTAIVRSVVKRLAHLDPAVVEGRARLTTHLLSTACADIEERAERSGDAPRWRETGTFLCDAIAGLLQAPITGP
ncbi:hypothetical protein [Nocardioides houyundeii]|uniref:hypothetical protein n=1 Tax=Nocardioides houyundeii TaxID=2045452 RepID=UPI00196596D1|nr:hypothetical protein [Nocardioides houyundeii]